jgi:hypothetical protein
MLLSDIFSIPFLICLAICILLIGCSSIYFYQRIMQQDHKISSMVSLISSLTEEEIVKPSSTTGTGNNPVGGNITIDFNPIKNRIQVSDDDSSDGESESGESESGESDGESDNDSVLEYSTSSSKCEILSEIEELNDMNAEEPEEPEELTLSDETIADELITEQRLDTTKSIHLESIDFSIFKTINVVGEEPDDDTNYKKMPISKLREIAQSHGHGDTSKLKKNELLKLLGVE